MITLQLTQEQLIEVTTALAAARNWYQQQAEASTANGEMDLEAMFTTQAAAWHDTELAIWRQYRAAAAEAIVVGGTR